MAEAKFKPTDKSVDRLIEDIPDEKVRDDCYELISIMKKLTGEEPLVWGGNIIGFGSYHYVYDSGHEGDASLAGFAVRKKEITLYVMAPDLPDRDESRIAQAKAAQESLEGAVLPLVSVLGLVHVEPKLAGRGPIA